MHIDSKVSWFQALEVAGQVAGTSVSTSPLPYDTMARHCENLGTGTRKKLSNWLTYENHYTRENEKHSPTFTANGCVAPWKVSMFYIQQLPWIVSFNLL